MNDPRHRLWRIASRLARPRSARRTRPDGDRQDGLPPAVAAVAEAAHPRSAYRLASPDAGRHSQNLPGGSIDEITATRIVGWCVDPRARHAPAKLELRLGDAVLAEFETNTPRADIARCFGTETSCGFHFAFSDMSGDLAAKALALYENHLSGSPRDRADLRVTVKGKAVELPRWEDAGSALLNATLLKLLQSNQFPGTVGWFDAAWYRAQNPVVGELGVDPYHHYWSRGWSEGRPPNRAIAAKLGRVGIKPHDSTPEMQAGTAALIAESGLLDPAWYSARYGVPDQDAILHYVAEGAFLGCDPSPFFSSFGYMTEHPESARAGQNPLAHLIRRGFAEGGSGSALLSGMRLTTRDWLKGL